ncbi:MULTISPECIES: hemerythrin domain-containing protein [Caproicibacterium]|jgi:hemerythrin-like domain-containing protein|uniref:Hemerythrin domain-containing protein n=1 Tax=Caproicibacterium argilliputei TaxID=3030016 RepID=A0AA97D847_9FIRM|nr:hemerythrin domain-containing protein [Caproicibacterium argilliputei]MDD4509789.1 hemerythrin domain-containing protein [Oscillospiraceae bacterium]WOC32089.1 hemerythrin domain-containing protein [Caproicibacterium argilliputei]
MNISDLKRQHTEILSLIASIETLSAENIDSAAKDIVYNINTLSGKMKMHLLSEDQFLYPSLMNSSDKRIKETACKFSEEMGGLAGAFQPFVKQYNVPSGITQQKDNFSAESKKVFGLIKERIENEDRKLYPLIEKL